MCISEGIQTESLVFPLPVNGNEIHSNVFVFKTYRSPFKAVCKDKDCLCPQLISFNTAPGLLK